MYLFKELNRITIQECAKTCIFITPYHEHSLQEKPVNELGEIFSEVSDILEAAAAMSDPLKGHSHVIQELEQLRERMKIPASNGRKSDGKRAGFMSCDVYTVHYMIMIFQFIFLFFFCCSFQVCCKLYHCLQPSVTCFTGKKTILVKCSAWYFIDSFMESIFLLWADGESLNPSEGKS